MTTLIAADHWEREGRRARRQAAFDSVRDAVRKGFNCVLIAFLVVAGLGLGGVVGLILGVLTGLIRITC